MHLRHLANISQLAGLALAVALAGCHPPAPAPDDNSLNTAVQAKLTADTAIGNEPIESFVQNGVVTLQGSVSSEAARVLAASDVAQVAGIRSVVNQLTVAPPQPAGARARAPQPTQPQPTLHARNTPPPPPPSRQPRQDPAPPPSAPIERRPPDSRPPDSRADDSRPDAQPPVARSRQPPPPPPPSFRNVTVPAGTTLPVRITQTLDSATAQPGDAFSGTLASDVVVDGLVALPAGTTVNGRVDQVHEAAHFKGSALLTLSLVGLNRHGERTTIASDPYTQEGNGRGKNTAEKVGGGAAVGAILGGIFGGGKGAAIGAAAGGGLGAGANGVTRGQQVQIPSETLIRFRLTNPVEVRASTATSTEGDANLQRHPGN